MNREQVIELIRKYNEGSASKEEIRLVENWFVKQSELRQREPEDVDYLDVKRQMWLNIDQQIDRPVLERRLDIAPARRSRLRFRIVAAAAVFIIAITAVFFYSNYKDVNGPQIVENDINPGKNKAVLTLANGQKISLTDALNGELAQQAGVTISKTANGQLIYQAAPNSSGKNTAEYNTIEAPRGGQWQVILPDGSKVFLNASSSLKYPVSFATKERKVELKGEAYFEISHNKKSPFRVIAKGQTVEVLGTHFNIMSYDDEKTVKTTLLSGSVKVSSNGSNVAGVNAVGIKAAKTAAEFLILKPGEQSQVSPGNMKLIHDVDLEDVLAWKNGYFKFNENLRSIMTKVSRWYDVEVVYETQPDPEFKFKGEISRDKNISELLNMLDYTGNVHFKIEGRRVIVKK
ncbi:FecR domain-containing protein [Pedobacter sp. FW305-3-2-15-E-R2A2]|uniref:FecR family protein n=1 Tax=Pedobacter sp. FW305-3-2-15-E-R2A2 TaxID=3140251 RepID=UPI0031404296